MIAFEDNEYVIHTIRKHWIVFIVKLLALIVAVILPVALVPLLSLVDGISIDTVMSIFSFFYVIYFLALWLVGFMMWTDYYLDIIVITNKRIIDMEQKGLFSREISTLRYESIQDVTTDVAGIIRTLLNFGNLYIQTAADMREFILDDISNPGLAKEIIMRELSRVLEKTE